MTMEKQKNTGKAVFRLALLSFGLFYGFGQRAFALKPFHFTDFARKNPFLMILGISGLFFVVVLGLLYVIVSSRKHTKQMFNLAYIDGTTRLWNEDGLKRQVQRLVNSGKNYAMVALDVRRFSVVNETYGRKMGDLVIFELAQLLKRFCSDEDIVAHCKGDHFILCLSYDNQEHLDFLISGICGILSKIRVEDVVLRFHPHMGVYLCDFEPVGFLEAIDRAELARRESKKSGEMVVYYRSALEQQLISEKKLAERIEFALENGELEVVYQPAFDLKSSGITGAEALVRWNHEERALLYPADFIGALERYGCISELDYFVLEEAMKTLRSQIDSGGGVTCLFVNQSQINFQKIDYVQQLQTLLNRYNIPKGLLCLELKTSFFENGSVTEEALRTLKNMGFLIGVDDFGRDGISLKLLSEVDVIKLDKRLLYEAEIKIKTQKILIRLIEMAKDLEITIACQGVEKGQQADLIKRLGCEIGQGFYFEKPMIQNKFLQRLDRNKTEAVAYIKMETGG